MDGRAEMKKILASAARTILSEAWDVINGPLYEEVGGEKQELVRQWLAGQVSKEEVARYRDGVRELLSKV